MVSKPSVLKFSCIIIFFACRNLRKWIQAYQNPSVPKQSARPHSATDSYKPNKQYDDSNNSGKPYRDKQKLKQQQYFAQQNQSEFQEFLQFKDSKTRGREAREQRKQRSESPRKDAYKGGYSSIQGYSPSFKQDKKQQFQILVSDFCRACLRHDAILGSGFPFLRPSILTSVCQHL